MDRQAMKACRKYRPVSGHDRGTHPVGGSRAVRRSKMRWALQAAEKRIWCELCNKGTAGHPLGPGPKMPPNKERGLSP